MNLKKILISILVISFALLLVTPALASYYFGSGGVPGTFGQEHSYSVLFRGNGEAVVGTKIKINNGDEEQSIDTLNIEVLNLRLNEVEVYQEFCQYKGSGIKVENKQCDQYYYRGENPYEKVFQKLDLGDQINNYQLKLHEAVEPLQTGVVLLSYRGFGYAKDGLFGRKKFDFPTLKTDSKITTAKIAVTVDTDLYFEGKKSTVDYNAGFDDAGLEYGTYTGLGAKSSALSVFSSGVGGRGQINKTANQLLPGEIFHVKGIYSTNWFGLNYVKLITFISILLAIIVIVVVISKVVGKRKKEREIAEPKPVAKTASEKPPLPVFQAILIGLGG